jgi:hypothetical protein
MTSSVFADDGTLELGLQGVYVGKGNHRAQWIRDVGGQDDITFFCQNLLSGSRFFTPYLALVINSTALYLSSPLRIGSFSRISNCNWGYGSRRVSRGFLTQLLHLPIGHRGVRPTDARREGTDPGWQLTGPAGNSPGWISE